MQYLWDTVTIVRHFTEIGNLGKKAQEILNCAENSFLISVVSLYGDTLSFGKTKN